MIEEKLRKDLLECLTGNPLIKICSNYSSGSAVGIITGKITNLTIIDFDNKDTYELLTEKHPDLKTYKTIQTKKVFIFGFDMMLI